MVASGCVVKEPLLKNLNPTQIRPNPTPSPATVIICSTVRIPRGKTSTRGIRSDTAPDTPLAASFTLFFTRAMRGPPLYWHPTGIERTTYTLSNCCSNHGATDQFLVSLTYPVRGLDHHQSLLRSSTRARGPSLGWGCFGGILHTYQ